MISASEGHVFLIPGMEGGGGGWEGGKGRALGEGVSPSLIAGALLLRMRYAGGCCVLTRRGPRGAFFSRRPQAAVSDERFTSQGSQQPPGSPLSREEGEAPPPAPVPEARRRSRRVRLRGSCRHRPSFLGCRELGTNGPARPAPASSEVRDREQ